MHAMAKFNKSQILMLSLLAALLIITPLLSSSLRPTYLYFIINILIIALGAEAGLLSGFPNPSDDKKHSVNYVSPKPLITSSEVPLDNWAIANTNVDVKVAPKCAEHKVKVVEKSLTEKIVKKCPSTPSLFFIGSGGETEAEDAAEEYYDQEEEQEEEEAGGISGQELFTKAETFIGNFYKQLKMQREDSWKRIHGLYQKAF